MFPETNTDNLAATGVRNGKSILQDALTREASPEHGSQKI